MKVVLDEVGFFGKYKIERVDSKINFQPTDIFDREANFFNIILASLPPSPMCLSKDYLQ